MDDRAVDRNLLGRMVDIIRHRGPDESGLYLDGPVGLGHARLSIIDLEGGRQPMHNEDRSISITFNGEIFNYVELREELIRKGLRLATSSDTEVILRLYEEEGEECVQRLNGQWAFAIWDRRKKKLFVSRDRLGVRPLFYTTAGRHFLFASEVKSILTHPAVSRQLDLGALDQVFTYWHTLPPRTAFEGVLELPPGHSLTVEDGAVKVWRYWQLDLSPNGTSDGMGREQDYAERLGDLLIDSTRIRLRADVPVGAYLSGGLDSSIIAALIRRFTDTPLETFSVAFEDAEFDESGFQRQVVSHLGTSHHEIRCSYDDVGGVFPQVIWHAEKPLLRTAPAPMYLLSRLVRDRGFKVVLTGEGADEVLGGYDIFKEAKIRAFWGERPTSKLRPLLLKRLYPYSQDIQRQPEAYLRMFFRVGPEDLLNPFFSHLPRWEMTRKLKLFFSDAVKSALQARPPYAEFQEQLPQAYDAWGRFERAQYLETAYLLPGYILSSQGDRMAMAHAVEGRFPFLDHRLVEFASKLPPSLKMRGLDEKHLLKKFASTLLPKSVIRRPKQPYRAPEVKSFFNSSTGAFRQPYIDDLLSPARISKYGVFNPAAVRMLVAKIKSVQATSVRDGMALVGILSTQLFLEQFVDNFNARTVHEPDSTEIAHVCN